MTPLQRNALASIVLPKERVEEIYSGALGTFNGHLRLVCVSHERLRAECKGLEVLNAEAEKRIAKAIALTDTGTPQFGAAFSDYPRGPSGWCVVDEIRRVLLEGKS